MWPVLTEIPIGWIAEQWISFLIPSIIFFLASFVLTQVHRKKLMDQEAEWKKTNDGSFPLTVRDKTYLIILSGFVYLSIFVLVLTFLSMIIRNSNPNNPHLTLPLRSYSVMLLMAFMAGMYLLTNKAKKEGIPLSKLLNLFMIIIVTSILGARYFFMVWETDIYFFYEPGRWISKFVQMWEGGAAVYGGLILATVSSIIYMQFAKLPIGKIVDMAAPSIAIGLFFARMGCFLNGCCFGAIVPDGACCVEFPIGVDLDSYQPNSAIVQLSGSETFTPSGAIDGASMTYHDAYHRSDVDVFVYATQFWSSMDGLFSFIFLSILYYFRRIMAFEGQIFLIFGMYHATSRAAIEYFRNDTERFLGLPFTAAQWIGMVLFTVCLSLMIFFWIRSKKQKTHQT